MCTKLENKGNLGAGLGVGPSYNSCVEPQQKEKIRYKTECEKCISINNGTEPNFLKYWNGGPKGDAQDACYDVFPEPSKITPEPEKDDIVAFNYGTGAKAYLCENPGIITDPDKPCYNKGNLGTGLGAGPGWGQCVKDTNEKMDNELNNCNRCINDGTESKYYIRDRNYCGDAYSTGYPRSIDGDIVAWNYGPNHKRSCNNPGVVTDQTKDC